jgi:branched-chain amino acid transport system permease protein
MDWRHRLTDAGITALVVLVLTTPIVGLKLIPGQAALGIEPHFGMVFILAGAAFVLRLALTFFLSVKGRLNVGAMTAIGATMGRQTKPIAAIALGGAVILPFVTNGHVIQSATMVLIYIMLGWGLNIVVGLAGLLDLGYVAFYGVGAYTFGLMSSHFGLGFWQCLPLAGLFSACLGMILGFPVLRLRGDYLAIVTLGFGEIIRIILLNWTSLTNGPNGIGDIPRPSFFGLSFLRRPPHGMSSVWDVFGLSFSPLYAQGFLYFVVMALALGTNLFTLRMRRLPIGRAWEALREDEIACRALGINPTNIKLSAFAIGAMFAGFAGVVFAATQTFISPESFTFSESAMILAIVVLGGMGRQMGIVLSATALVTLQEALRDFDQYRMLMFGAAMVAIMVARPRGLLSYRAPSILLPPVQTA